MTTTYIIQREDNVKGRSPEILVAKISCYTPQSSLYHKCY
jgi:hypothetical protein